jgi:hypothetical protein
MSQIIFNFRQNSLHIFGKIIKTRDWFEWKLFVFSLHLQIFHWFIAAPSRRYFQGHSPWDNSEYLYYRFIKILKVDPGCLGCLFAWDNICNFFAQKGTLCSLWNNWIIFTDHDTILNTQKKCVLQEMENFIRPHNFNYFYSFPLHGCWYNNYILHGLHNMWKTCDPNDIIFTSLPF